MGNNNPVQEFQKMMFEMLADPLAQALIGSVLTAVDAFQKIRARDRGEGDARPETLDELRAKVKNLPEREVLLNVDTTLAYLARSGPRSTDNFGDLYNQLSKLKRDCREAIHRAEDRLEDQENATDDKAAQVLADVLEAHVNHGLELDMVKKLGRLWLETAEGREAVDAFGELLEAQVLEALPGAVMLEDYKPHASGGSIDEAHKAQCEALTKAVHRLVEKLGVTDAVDLANVYQLGFANNADGLLVRLDYTFNTRPGMHVRGESNVYFCPWSALDVTVLDAIAAPPSDAPQGGGCVHCTPKGNCATDGACAPPAPPAAAPAEPAAPAAPAAEGGA